jgi:uncharacterized protein DUF1348
MFTRSQLICFQFAPCREPSDPSRSVHGCRLVCRTACRRASPRRTKTRGEPQPCCAIGRHGQSISECHSPERGRSTAVNVRLAEDGGNSRDPEKVAGAYSLGSKWRNRAKFLTERDEIVAFLKRKWQRSTSYAASD